MIHLILDHIILTIIVVIQFKEHLQIWMTCHIVLRNKMLKWIIWEELERQYAAI